MMAVIQLLKMDLKCIKILLILYLEPGNPSFRKSLSDFHLGGSKINRNILCNLKQ